MEMSDSTAHINTDSLHSPALRLPRSIPNYGGRASYVAVDTELSPELRECGSRLA